ncbi:endonuclease/exonuclease/phosphatase family protein [Asanoa sp. WMMD1127]|uniref:endonuclease/exonuclease/phosphatase family protein n=1 Tax=Asanoa sp. WMMD1127 TaxID=3016107 RepID=UPI002416FCD9|nr:endonuclease/exonuclease/phosphatase family protein [Asanoa sp. WMMD1127]MDG4824012.1 endonuclease/exonuclease/phosphatase family protein [Asanoa sp. WMMD1127]
MTYNIKTGGYDGSRGARLDDIAEVIASARPDIVALQELRGESGPWLAERLGMRMVRARSFWGQPVAILTDPEWTVLSAGSVARPFHHAAARAEVATLGGPLTVISAHLNPHWGWRRLAEARWLVNAVGRARLALVMGDLNTLDPWTDHQERLRALPPPYRVRHLRRRPFGRPPSDRDVGALARVDTRAIAALDAAGLIDVFRTVGEGPAETAPTALGGAEFSGMRLDYMFATQGLRDHLRSCRVLRTPAADRASDHYALLAEIDI